MDQQTNPCGSHLLELLHKLVLLCEGHKHLRGGDRTGAAAALLARPPADGSRGAAAGRPSWRGGEQAGSTQVGAIGGLPRGGGSKSGRGRSAASKSSDDSP